MTSAQNILYRWSKGRRTTEVDCVVEDDFLLDWNSIFQSPNCESTSLDNIAVDPRVRYLATVWADGEQGATKFFCSALDAEKLESLVRIPNVDTLDFYTQVLMPSDLGTIRLTFSTMWYELVKELKNWSVERDVVVEHTISTRSGKDVTGIIDEWPHRGHRLIPGESDRKIFVHTVARFNERSLLRAIADVYVTVKSLNGCYGGWGIDLDSLRQHS